MVTRMNNNQYDIKAFSDNLEITLEESVELFSSYISEMNIYCIQLKQHLIKENYKELEKIVHSIKGVSGNLNIMDVYEEAAAVDDLLKAKSLTNIAENVKMLLLLIGDSEIKIKNYFSNYNISL